MSEKLKIVIDHDAGTNPDDILAFLLLLNMPGVDILLTISGNNHPVERARYAYQFFSLAGRGDIPCFAGEANGYIDFYGQNAANKISYHPPRDYLSALREACVQNDRIVYLAIQGLSNLNKFLMTHPEHAYKLSVYHMGLTLTGADKAFVTGGTNLEADPIAAKHIYERHGLDLHVIGSHTTINDQLRITPETELHRKLAQSDKTHEQMAYQALLKFHERRSIWPALHDPLTASAAAGKDFVEFETRAIEFRVDGSYRLGEQTRLSISAQADYTGFMNWFSSIL